MHVDVECVAEVVVEVAGEYLVVGLELFWGELDGEYAEALAWDESSSREDAESLRDVR